ncbi:Hypothetical protein POVN_LOCUS411 [uncultured virus]|nr:Hypothetical protein POVN_LOCUS411 [uncultured virus]
MELAARLRNVADYLEAVATKRKQEDAEKLLQWVTAGGFESFVEPVTQYLQQELETLAVIKEQVERKPILKVFDAFTLECLNTLLGEWEVDTEIGSGEYGTVYSLSSSTEEKRALKTIRVTGGKKVVENEIKIARLAGELGVGPKIYDATFCQGEGVTTAYIVMQRLSGPQLTQVYPYTADQLMAAMDLYYAFYQQTGYLQNDLTSRNVVYDGDRLYILDYGRADVPTFKFGYGVSHYMDSAAGMLIGTLTDEANDDNPWLKDDIKSRSLVFLTLLKARTAWLTKTFPDYKENLQHREHVYSTEDIDIGLPEYVEYLKGVADPRIEE